jgi:hypothetical protein
VHSITLPYTFSPGNTISSSQVNANLQALGQALPASKTSASSGTLTITSSATATPTNITSLAVTSSSNGYLLVFGRATVTSASGDVTLCILPTDSSGVVDIGSGAYIGSDSLGEMNMVYTRGAVTAGTTLYFSLGAYS